MIARLDEFFKHHPYLRRCFFVLLVIWPLLFWVSDNFYGITDLFWFRSSFVYPFIKISEKGIYCLLAYIGACVLFVASYAAADIKINGGSLNRRTIDLFSKQSFGFKVALAGLSPIAILIISSPISFLNNWGADNTTLYTISLILIAFAWISIWFVQKDGSKEKPQLTKNAGLVAIGLLVIFFYLKPNTWSDYYDSISGWVYDYMRNPKPERLKYVVKEIDNARDDGVTFDLDFIKEKIDGTVVPKCRPYALQQFREVTGINISNARISREIETINKYYKSENPSEVQAECIRDVSSESFVIQANALKGLIVHLCSTKRIACY